MAGNTKTSSLLEKEQETNYVFRYLMKIVKK